DEVTFTLTATNTGEVAIPLAMPIDPLPDELEFVSASHGGVEFNLLGIDVVGWPTFDLPVGASIDIELVARVKDETPPGTYVNRLILIAMEESVADPGGGVMEDTPNVPPPVVNNACGDAPDWSCAEVEVREADAPAWSQNKSVDRQVAQPNWRDEALP